MRSRERSRAGLVNNVDYVTVEDGLRKTAIEVPKVPRWHRPILKYSRVGRYALGGVMLFAAGQGVIKDHAVNDLTSSAVANVNVAGLQHIDHLAATHKITKGQVITMLNQNAGQQFSKDVAVFTSDQQTLEDDAAELISAGLGIGILALGSGATKRLSNRALRKRQNRFREQLEQHGLDPNSPQFALSTAQPEKKKKHPASSPALRALKVGVGAGAAIVGASVVAPGLFTKAVSSVGTTADNGVLSYRFPEQVVNYAEASEVASVETTLTNTYWKYLPDVSKYLNASKSQFKSYITSGFESNSNPNLNIAGNFVNDVRYLDGVIAPQFYIANSNSNPNWALGGPLDALIVAGALVAERTRRNFAAPAVEV